MDTPAYLGLDFGEEILLPSYDIRNIIWGWAGYHPVDWTFQTSLDGSEYTDQHSVAGNTNFTSQAQLSGNPHGYVLSTPVRCRYARLKITGTDGDYGPGIGDFLIWKQAA